MKCFIIVDSHKSIFAGDDDLAHVFSLTDFKYLKSLKSHEATVFFACFTHDSSHVVTGDNDGLLFVWNWTKNGQKPQSLIDDAHDLGISCGDCMPESTDCQYSLVLTGGNDCLIKVWKVWVKGAKKGSIEHMKTLSGHGSTVMSVKFATSTRVFASTSGDKTLRLWDANSMYCIRVLEGHDRYVGCCAFNLNSKLLVSGSNDRSYNIWKLSGYLMPATYIESDALMRPSSGAVAEWSYSDAMKVFKKPSSDPPGIENPGLEGKRLSNLSYDELVKKLGMSKADAQRLLRSKLTGGQNNIAVDTREIPDEFICPITQDVMVNPVLCSDGFIYEKAAIQEWLISRKKTSPMTNLAIKSTKLEPQSELKKRIADFMN